MVKSHKIKLYPNKSQQVLLKKSCGVARFAYNWALNKWQEDYKNGIKNSAYSLVNHLNSIKKTEFPWMQDTGKTCSQYAIHNVEKAFKKMWKDGNGYPSFKKKGGKDSFVSVENKQQFKQKDFKIKLPKIGWIKCAENLRFSGEVNNVSVKRVADMWFAIINIEVNPIETPLIGENQAVIGVDMGVKSLIVLSDGVVFKNPLALTKNIKKLKQRQRKASKKTPGSNNKKRAQIKLARLHNKITCIRTNAIHQATSFIVKKYDRIVIEDLRVRNMVKNKCLSRSILDASFGEISRQLAYKSEWYGKELVKADLFFASSKTCSGCGSKKKIIKLSERVYRCDNCGISIDRDLNAAKNLAKYSPTEKFSESEACGADSSSLATKKRSAKKHEISILGN